MTEGKRRPIAKSQDPPGASGLMPEPWLQPSSIGKRVPKVDQRRPLHYLVPPFGEPIILDSMASHVTVLGRDEECDVQIKSPTVSRKHAEITFKGEKAHVKDLGGTNGTRVNGDLLAGERDLSDRDVLKLGDITAVYRVVAAKDRGKIETESSPSMEKLNSTMRIASEALEKGSRLVADVPLVTIQNVFGRLTLLRADGVFTVEVDGSAGHVRFEQGRVTDAKFGDRTGDAAVKTIASLNRGRCRFDAK